MTANIAAFRSLGRGQRPSIKRAGLNPRCWRVYDGLAPPCQEKGDFDASFIIGIGRYDWKTKTPDTTGIVPGLFSAASMGATNLNLRGGFEQLIRQKRNRSTLSRKGGFPSPRTEVGFIRLRLFALPNSGTPDFGL